MYLRLEEELRQKEAYAERVKQMTKSLEQLQVRTQAAVSIQIITLYIWFFTCYYI